MKTKHFLVLLAFFSFFMACDKVELPLPKPLPTDTVDTFGFPSIDTAALNVSTRKVMVEEFTGHKCTGCPEQTRKLLALQASNGHEIIVLSYHAGTFAETDSKYPTDYTTTHGNDLHLSIESMLNGYPSAMVNRETDNLGNKIYLAYNKWVGPINDQLNNIPNLAIGVASNYLLEEDKFNVNVSIKALENVTDQHRLVVICTEDSVISAQLDNGVFISDYAHRHVVRSEITTQGQLYGDLVITTSGLNAGEWLTKKFTLSKPANVVNPEKCIFVAYLINVATETIAQSEEGHVEILE